MSRTMTEKENILYKNEVSTRDDLLLYSHLYSHTFDVPYCEKATIW